MLRIGERLKGDVFRSVFARAMTLPITAIATMAMTWMVLSHRGVETYAAFAIFISLPYLIPISDFGISVVITDVLARYGARSMEFRRAWFRVCRLLVITCTLTIACGGLISFLGGWSPILGLSPGEDAELSGFVMSCSLGSSIFLGVGQRVLLGLQEQRTWIMMNAASSPLALGLIAASVAAFPAGVFPIVTSFALGNVLTQLAIFSWALYRLGGWPKSAQGGSEVPLRILESAAPMAALSIILPLAYQSDRLFLSHFSTPEEVANYSIVSTLYMPLLSIVTVGSQSLWPRFLSIQKTGRRLERSFKRATNVFTWLGAVGAIGLLSLGPYLERLIGASATDAPFSMYILFGVLLGLFGYNAAGGMLQMDAKGRAVQATGALFMLVAKILLAFFLVPNFGGTGAVAATVFAVSLFMIVPTRISAVRRLQRREFN